MDAPSIPIGTRIGVYRVESLIGSGGMGSVYRAVHSKLGRKAAIKVLADSLAADPAYVSRFFHEARVVSEVGHPNIVDVIDFIESDQPRRVAYVMELVDGPPLSRVLKTHRLMPGQVINISLQLLDALAAVHKINVVHRDLKPDNILLVGSIDTDLSARPCIKVLDFGIAKIQSPDALHKTTTGMMLGTPAYMSPEQVSGEPVSNATDVYAFGEILFEMLTGRRLFEGKGRAIMKAKVSDHPPPIELPQDLPHRQHFTLMVRGCLQPDQSARPTIAQLSETLRSMLGGKAKITPMMIAPAPAPPMQASTYQATLNGVVNTSVVGPPRSKAMALAIAGVFAFLIAGILLVALLRDPDPITVKSIPLEEPEQQIAAPPPPPPPIAPIAPPPPEAPPPVVKQPAKRAEAPKKVPPKPRERAKPLKKGEFPTW